MSTEEKPEIPAHTKWGIRISTIIILLISVMIIKNCVGSIKYGVSTEQDLQTQFYELGYSHGKQKAQGMERPDEPETENLLLKKLYRKGYRNGWDSAQPGQESQTDSEPPPKDQ
jgi:hypothetical protein